MYTTFAGLRLDGEGWMEYSIAGNLPVLHYRQSRKQVVRLSMEQFPLGRFPSARYFSRRVDCGSGDLFAIFTDGLVENMDLRDDEFGLHRTEDVLLAFAGRSLPAMYDAVLDAVGRHGKQADDRTLMLVRAFAETKEQLGGYYLVDAKDVEEAIAMAAKVPWARYGSIEVRPILTFSCTIAVVDFRQAARRPYERTFR
jgi:Stage II sporulation protein E (SpoIIE)/YCII-related domain